MRLFYAIIIIALNSALVFGQEAEFRFDKKVHKFSKSIEGAILEHTFIITNSGSVPLIISDYQVECSCTKAVLPTEPILPGESFNLIVTFDTAGKYDFQDRSLDFKANTKNGKATVRIKVRVINPK